MIKIKDADKKQKRPIAPRYGSGYISLPRQRSFVDAVNTYSHVKKNKGEGRHNDSRR